MAMRNARSALSLSESSGDGHWPRVLLFESQRRGLHCRVSSLLLVLYMALAASLVWNSRSLCSRDSALLSLLVLPNAR